MTTKERMNSPQKTARVAVFSIVGMNATILENTIVSERSIVVGTPAKVVKTVDDDTYSMMKKHALRYYELARSHKGSLFT